jgi:hypothetical protein
MAKVMKSQSGQMYLKNYSNEHISKGFKSFPMGNSNLGNPVKVYKVKSPQDKKEISKLGRNDPEGDSEKYE